MACVSAKILQNEVDGSVIDLFVVVVVVFIREEVIVKIEVVKEMVVSQKLSFRQSVLERSHEVPHRDAMAVLETDLGRHRVDVEGHALAKLSGADRTNQPGIATNSPVLFDSCKDE